MKRTAVVVSLALIFALALSSCQKIKELTEQAVKQATDSNPARDMLGNYAKGYNAILDVCPGVIDNYKSRIPLETGPSAELGDNVWLISAGTAQMSLKTAKDSFAAAADGGPEKYKHLKPMADEVYAACNGLVNVYNDASKYYEAQDFKDDEFKRGQELHGNMLTAIEKYHKTMRVLDAALGGEEDKLMEEELAQYKDGKGYGYYLRYLPHHAKKALNLLQSPDTDDAAAGKGIEEFIAVYNEVKTFADGKADLNGTFKSFMDQAESYLGTLKRFRRAVQAEPQDAAALNRELDQMVTDYNNIINLQNALFQLEGYNQLN